ncbi:MAG: hypothetical protein ACPL2D_10585 [Ignavibacteria bacterium]
MIKRIPIYVTDGKRSSVVNLFFPASKLTGYWVNTSANEIAVYIGEKMFVSPLTQENLNILKSILNKEYSVQDIDFEQQIN